MPSRVVNERHAQAMDAGNATGRMIGRIAAIIMATLVTLATVFAFGSTTSAAFAASSSYADYATWSAVAEDINKQLAQGESAYRSGNTYQAATDFQNARWMNYDASNFSTVVNNTIGEDKQKALLQEFTDLETLAYQQNNADTIAGKVDALSNDIAATAQTLDANSSLANPRDYAKQRDAQTTKERQQLDAVKKNSSKGKGDRTWSDVAKEMNVILDKAYKAAISGKGDEGSSLVNNAYYQYYEKLGFEKNVMNAISGDRVSQVEYQFKMTRKTMRDGGSQKGIKTLVDDLKSWLIEDAATLDGGAADGVNGFAKFITSSIGQAFLVLIREGLEALLVVAAAIAVANLMASAIGERGAELALLKAIGATDGAVSRLMLAETAVISLIGAVVGALLGSGMAQIVGHVVFGSGITMRPMVFVLVFVLLAVTVLLASFSSIRSILNLKPAEVLHGR